MGGRTLGRQAGGRPLPPRRVHPPATRPALALPAAGKTTLLRHVLQNSDLKIGCIVNDVASVNIDAKLIRGAAAPRDGQPATATTADLADTIELANGCACCRWAQCAAGEATGA